MSSQFTIHRHHRSEDEQIFDLQQLVYPDHPIYRDRELTRQYWQWRYYANPEIQSTVYVAKSRNGPAIAGMRPISLLTLLIRGQPVPCVMLTAVITHPACRKQGVFSSLVKHSLAEAKSQGAQYAFTFPNERSFAVYKNKPEWRHVASIPLAVKIVNLASLLQAKVRPRLLATFAGGFGQSLSWLCRPFLRQPVEHPRISLQCAKTVDASYDELWNRVSDRYPIILKRDTNYLRWRYVDNPIAAYEFIEARDRESNSLKGYVIIDIQRRFGVQLGLIVDLLVESEDTQISSALVSKAVQRLKDRGAAAACCLAPKHQVYTNSLKRNGFAVIPEWLNRKHFYFLCTQLGRDAALDEDFFSFDRWYMTWGDTDNV